MRSTVVFGAGARVAGRARRQLAEVATQQLGREFIAAAAAIVATTVAFQVAVNQDRVPAASLDFGALTAALAGGAVVLAVVAGAMSIVRFRLVGDAPALDVGVAMVVLAGGVIGVGQLAPALDPGRSMAQWSFRVHDAATVVAVVALLAATRRRRPARTLAARAALAVAGVGGLTALFALVGHDGGAHPALESLERPGRLAAGGAWTVVAVVMTLHGLRQARWLFTWFGLMCFGLAAAYGLAQAPTTSVGLRAAGVCLLELLALVCAIRGGVRELERGVRDYQRSLRWTRHELEDARTDSRVTAETLARVRADHQERAHDARSVVLTLQATARAIEHDADPDVAPALVGALRAEIERLRGLLVGDRDSPASAMPLRVALEPLITCRRAAGQQIVSAIPDRLEAAVDPGAVAEIVQNLLENAHRHAPGSVVVVRARGHAGHVVLRVEDRGPGVHPGDRERIFERSVRGRGADHTVGSGLGLYVARRLAREQGGDLTVETGPGGGASFVLTLPTAPVRSATHEEVGV